MNELDIKFISRELTEFKKSATETEFKPTELSIYFDGDITYKDGKAKNWTSIHIFDKEDYHSVVLNKSDVKLLISSLKLLLQKMESEQKLINQLNNK